MSKLPVIDPVQAAAELCKRKLSFFVKEFWEVIIADDLIWSPHMDVICDEVQEVYERVIAWLPKDYDLIINVPPGSTKSTLVTIMAPAWGWTKAAWLRYITASYSDGLSTEHAVKSRDIIRSDKYRRYFPEVVIKKDEDNKTNYKTVSNGQRFATSTGATITGVHGHINTLDDLLSTKQAVSVAQIEEANRFLDKDVSTRKVDKKVTATILIMQRLASNDPTGHLLDKKGKKIRLICLPGTISDNVKPASLKEIYRDGLLDPVRLGQSALDELRVDLGEAGYAGQIDQLPVPAGGLIWKKWFIEIPDADFPTEGQATGVATDWDTAFTDDEKNAANAYITSGKINGKLYIFDFGWDWLEAPELVKWMKTKPAPHYIEAKASGKSSKQILTRMGITAVEVKVKGGADKVARANNATPHAEGGMICIKKSMADKFYNDSKQGILFFPKGHYKDLADCLAQCIQRNFNRKGSHVMKEKSGSDWWDALDG